MHQKIIYFILLVYIAISSSAQTNKALLIAINSHPAGSGWTKIHAVNDTTIIIPMLIRKGYQRNNIKTLTNNEATKQAIVHELKSIDKHSKPGDCIYIHFSCHGQQMIDDNGDEPDGLDEALIPYDAQRWYEKGIYEGENHLKDDEFEVLLNAIRKKAGMKGNVIVILDACHSGTADRATDDDIYTRGTIYIFGPDSSKPVKRNVHKTMYPLQRGKDMAPITILSACQPDQINYEHKTAQGIHYGSLSYAFHEVINSINADISTNGIFEKLKSQMKEMFINKEQKQTPYFESTQKDERFTLAK